jgi:hypothetical protein
LSPYLCAIRFDRVDTRPSGQLGCLISSDVHLSGGDLTSLTGIRSELSKLNGETDWNNYWNGGHKDKEGPNLAEM